MTVDAQGPCPKRISTDTRRSQSIDTRSLWKYAPDPMLDVAAIGSEKTISTHASDADDIVEAVMDGKVEYDQGQIQPEARQYH